MQGWSVGNRRAHRIIIRIRTVLCLALLIAPAAMAQSSSFLLGVDYSEWYGVIALRIATDNSGAVYVLGSCPGNSGSCVTKLSADGNTILWQNQLAFSTYTMAVDPSGGVYVVPVGQLTDTTSYVAKLGASGSGLAWEVPLGALLSPAPAVDLAVDSQGRAYAAGVYGKTNQEGSLVRLNAAGNAIDYTVHLKGTPAAIAVDASGAAYVTGTGVGADANAGFLERAAPNGSAGFYTALPQDPAPMAVAIDGSGNAVVIGSGEYQRVDSKGAVTLTASVPGGWGLALDAAGNAYITGASYYLYPVKNSLAACGWLSTDSNGSAAGWLTVVAPDGSILQTTYIPGTVGSPTPGDEPLIATGPNSTVFVAALSGTTFAPTQAGPFPVPLYTFGSSFLIRFSPDTNAQTVPLACVGNAASFQLTAVAPGEAVSLFGNGLGPKQGVQPQASLQDPYPTQAAGVQVTFDGVPVPLLWVQDVQINAVAPWSLTPGENTQVCVAYNGANTNCLTWPVVQASPAVFTVDGTYALAMNQDGTRNSAAQPAAVGSIVTIWATGLGPIAPAQADGSLIGLPLPSDVLPAGVQAKWSIQGGAFGFPGLSSEGTEPFVVTYLGPAPYMAAGISQINFKAAQYPFKSIQDGIVVTLPSTQSPVFQIYVAGQ